MTSYNEFCKLLPTEMAKIVSRETFSLHLKNYEMLLKWQTITQLISHSTISDYWKRHVVDSLQLQYLYPDHSQWLDIGSGGGFPSLPISIQNCHNKNFEMYMIESNIKKASFLRYVSAMLHLNAFVYCQRIEDGFEHKRFQNLLITARALADLNLLLRYAFVISKSADSYECAFFKSNNIKDELTRAQEYWRFDYQVWTSLVDPRGSILIVRNIREVNRR